MKIDVKAVGLGKAKHQLAALAMINAAYRGVEMRGSSRRGDSECDTNAEVKESLARGGRDIGPNDEDGELASKAFVASVEAFLRMQNDKAPTPTGLTTQAAAKAWRAAGQAVAENTLKRLEASKDKDGQVIEVRPGYAAARAAKYGMANSTSIVYKASGQFLEDYANRAGLRLVK